MRKYRPIVFKTQNNTKLTKSFLFFRHAHVPPLHTSSSSSSSLTRWEMMMIQCSFTFRPPERISFHMFFLFDIRNHLNHMRLLPLPNICPSQFYFLTFKRLFLGKTDHEQIGHYLKDQLLLYAYSWIMTAIVSALNRWLGPWGPGQGTGGGCGHPDTCPVHHCRFDDAVIHGYCCGCARVTGMYTHTTKTLVILLKCSNQCNLFCIFSLWSKENLE